MAWDDTEVRDALKLSIKVGARRDRDRDLLGTALAFALHRFRFFGRDSISFLFLLPLALPGIITGMSLNRFYDVAGLDLSLWTIVVGHATFCVVVVYNNVVARLRRTSASLIEASMDLGADGWQTFRYVTLPTISDRARRRRAAGVRALVRRGDRHLLHGRGRTTRCRLHLRLHPPGAPAPGRQRVALVVLLLTVIPVVSRCA